MTVILDASALLALLFDERGADTVAEAADGAAISTVNLTEVLEKVAHHGGDAAIVPEQLSYLRIAVIAFNERHARHAAELKPLVAGKRISLADRACLALARESGRPILTGDRVWTELDLGLDIRLMR